MVLGLLEYLFGALPVLLDRSALRGAQQNQIPRVLVRLRVIIISLSRKLHVGQLLVGNREERGLIAH